MNFYHKLSEKKTKLELIKKNNENYINMKKNLEDVTEVKNELERYIQFLTVLLGLCKVEDNLYREKRIKYITSYIDKNLNIIFPEDGFESHIHFDYKNRSQKVTLTLTKSDGIERIPRINEGGMLKQLISFSASVGLCESMGKKAIYMDEAFSASSPENLTKVGKLLNHLLQSEFQILAIEQKDDIYKDLPRREIRLRRDTVNNKVEITGIYDY